MEKILNYINNNKILSWILRNGFALSLGLAMTLVLFDKNLLTMIVAFFIVLAGAILGTNFTLYTLSDFRISKDALKNANDGDGKINPILQKTYLEFIGRVFGWNMFLMIAVLWLIFSDLIKESLSLL